MIYRELSKNSNSQAVLSIYLFLNLTIL